MKSTIKLSTILFLIIISFTNCQKDNSDNVGGNTSSDNGGKTYIFLTGNVTDTEAQDIIDEDLGVNTQVIEIANTIQLTTVDLSSITELVDLRISDNSILSSINLTNLETINRSLIAYNNQALVTLDLPKLKNIYGYSTISDLILRTLSLPLLEFTSDFSIYANLTSLDLGALQTVNGGLSFNSLNTTMLDLSKLESVRDDFDLHESSITSIDLASLQSMGACRFEDNESLASISFPSLKEINGQGNIIDNDNLQTINIPVLEEFGSLGLENALSSTSVNSVLARLVSITPSLSNKTVFLSQTPAAAPTGQGLNDKTTLINNGNNVYTN